MPTHIMLLQTRRQAERRDRIRKAKDAVDNARTLADIEKALPGSDNNV